MQVKTFRDDLLDRQQFASRLDKFIETERNFVQGSLVIALSSKFGSGKTTFLTMWKSEVERLEVGPRVIELNAWESDYYGDPLFAIVSSILDSLDDTSEATGRLLDAAKEVGWFATAILGQFANKLSGVDAIAAGKLAEEKRAQAGSTEVLRYDSFSLYRERTRAMTKLKEAIAKVVSDLDRELRFVVDELDRCRPDYAISYLETIKHVFDVPGAVFILAADRDQLKNSAEMAFGANLDFDEYYRKFIHREVALPPITDSAYKKLALEYVPYYLQRDELRSCIMKIDTAGIENIVELIAALRLTPRQIQEVFRILGHVLSTSDPSKGHLRWGLAVGTIAMASFSVGHRTLFDSLVAQQHTPPEAKTSLTQLLGDKTDWWFQFFLAGNGFRLQADETEEEVLTQLGLGPDTGSTYLRAFRAEFGHRGGNVFADIRDKIEQLSRWG